MEIAGGTNGNREKKTKQMEILIVNKRSDEKKGEIIWL